jgi:methionyl-tRNA formyltransferase
VHLKKLKTLFFGTPDFSVATLELLQHHPLIELVGVISMPDRPAGRGQEFKSPEVISYAKNHKLPFFQTENINKEEALLETWKNEKVDLIIVLAFAQFLGSKVLQLPLLGCFNIHTSLLPKYRGAAPIQYALWNGDKETGVSIQRMVKKMDAGNIVFSVPAPIFEYETGGLLTTRLKHLASLATAELVEKIFKHTLDEKVQDESLVSFAPTLKKEDGWLDFATQNSTALINRFRATDPWPGSYAFLSGKRLKVLSLEKFDHKLAPGKIVNHHNHLLVGSADGCLRLTRVQLEGKKATTDIELLNGYKSELTLTGLPKASE